MITRHKPIGTRSGHHSKLIAESRPVYIGDLRTPWLLHVRKPKNRGNAGAGMKVKNFLKTVDRFFPGGAK